MYPPPHMTGELLSRKVALEGPSNISHPGSDRGLLGRRGAEALPIRMLFLCGFETGLAPSSPTGLGSIARAVLFTGVPLDG